MAPGRGEPRAGTFALRRTRRGVPCTCVRQARAHAPPPALRAGAPGLPGLRRAAGRPARGAVRRLPRSAAVAARAVAARGAPCRRTAARAAPRRRARPRRSWAPLAHAGPAAALVHALKHRGALRAADAMAAALAANAPPGCWRPRRGRRRPPSSCRCRPTPGAGGRAATTTPRGWPPRSAGAPGWTSVRSCAGRTPRRPRSARRARPAWRPGGCPWRSCGRLRPVRGSCSSTTSRRPGRPWPRAPRRCAPQGSRRSWRSPTPGP